MKIPKNKKKEELLNVRLKNELNQANTWKFYAHTLTT